MKRILTVKHLSGGFTLNNGAEGPYADDYDVMQDAIGAVVLNFLDECGGNTCMVTIEGPDKKPKEA